MGHLSPADMTFNGRSLVTEVFIETGTYLGQTLERLLPAKQFQVYRSIERLQHHHDETKDRLRYWPNLYLYLGSSPYVLPEILEPERPTTFWLDAHYQGRSHDEIDPRFGECPLLPELKVILDAPWKQLPFIIIDDAMIFQSPKREDEAPPPDILKFDFRQWPTAQRILKALRGRYDMEERNNQYYCLPKE